MEDQWRIAKYDPAWRDLFLETGSKLREALGKRPCGLTMLGPLQLLE